MESIVLGNQTPSSWPQATTNYVTAVVVDEDGRTLILEGTRPESKALSWQIIGCALAAGANPIAAVQQELRHYLGHDIGYWVYLGSYEEAKHGVGHFFLAQNVPVTETLPPPPASAWQAKWVPVCDLRAALLDGRLSNISFAANVAVALYLFPPTC